MRILHTADWHLGDRLGRQDRTDDLRRAVERVAGYCTSEKVDVLLVAGDLFSELAPPDGLRDAIRHLQETFGGFLDAGGAILALTGNHDKENFCQTLRHAMTLAAPAGGRPGDLVPPGRLYLATNPTWLRLPDRTTGAEVQFVMMPYPTPTRYLTEESAQAYQGFDEKNRHLMRAFTEWLREVRLGPRLQPGAADRPRRPRLHAGQRPGDALPSHRGGRRSFRGNESAGRIRLRRAGPHPQAAIPRRPDPRPLLRQHRAARSRRKGRRKGRGPVRRRPGGAARRTKSPAVGGDADGRGGNPGPAGGVARAGGAVSRGAVRLARVRCTYTAGVDNREETLRKLEEIFPRWYDREMNESGALGRTLTVGEAPRTKSFEDTVRDYLRQELCNHDDALRDAVLARAETLLGEVQA